MNEPNKNRIDLFGKFEFAMLRITTIILFIMGLAKLLFAELKNFETPVDFQQIRHVLPTLAIWLSAVSILVGLIYLFVFLLRRQSGKTVDLKQNVATAFMQALDKSSFNPHRFKEDKNEQYSTQTAE
jgi:hypothetical protein